jgi:hypothetical protein
MKNMGYESSTETADSILREVDFGRKGYIEFGEYLDVSYLNSQCCHVLMIDCRWIEGVEVGVCLHTFGTT